jgi:glycosyltransferase involved in cell wall biosynthesis
MPDGLHHSDGTQGEGNDQQISVRKTRVNPFHYRGNARATMATMKALLSRRQTRRTNPVIILGVTVDQSMKLLRGQPQYLTSAGWEVHVVSAGDSGLPPEYFLGPLGSVRTHSLDMTRDPSLARDLASFWKWLKIIRQLRPDVVCLGTPKASLVGLTAARLLRVPSRIYLLRGLRLEGETGPRQRILIAAERITAAMSTQVLAVGDSLRSAAEAAGIGRKRPLSVVGRGSSNGVEIPSDPDIEALRRARRPGLRSLGLNPDDPVVGYVGRLTPDKGVHLLAEACVSLRADGVPVQLLLVGAEDSHRYQSIVTGPLEAAGVPHAVTGYVESTRPFLVMMDVFCLPSIREGMPNVSLEAASVGLPVVTSEATGCKDAVLPGISGLTFQHQHPESLVEALRGLLDDPAKRRRLGTAGREWVAANFERGTVWRLYENSYRRTLRR